MKSAGTIQKNTEKRASHDVLFSLCENAADRLILLVLLGSVLLFILWPIACIALRSLRGADGGVSFAMFGTVLRQYGESLRNSVFVGVFTAVLSTILSLSAALVCATARGWKKTLCMVIMLVAMVSPPFVSSLAYIQLYGRRGWITYRLLHLSLNPYNRWGVILMQSISFVPLNAMFLSGILEKLDEGSLRSARDLGASGGAILRDIVLPLIRPATLVCLLLSFVRSLADFGTPIIIGGRFSTLAADIYLQVVGYSDLEKSSAMNMFLLIPSIVFFFVYRALMRRSDRLTEGSRTAQTELGLLLPHCGAMGWGMIALSTVFFVMIVLQYCCLRTTHTTSDLADDVVLHSRTAEQFHSSLPLYSQTLTLNCCDSYWSLSLLNTPSVTFFTAPAPPTDTSMICSLSPPGTQRLKSSPLPDAQNHTIFTCQPRHTSL